jgi:hypothetical protein
MNNIDNLPTRQKTDFLEQGRETLLNLGYRYINFKSKVRKRLAKLVKVNNSVE